MSETYVNSEHKDRLFNFIFGREENKKWTLNLYNAVNGSNYSDPELITFNTLENFLYMSMRNDISQNKDVEFSVSKAIDGMPEIYEIRKFLVVHKTEVANMLLAEWNEQDAIETIRKTERNEGRKEGLEIGINGTVEILRSTGMDDVSIINKISEQYNLSYDKAKTYLQS